MKEPQSKRVRIVGLRFTKEEFERLEQQCQLTTTPQLSEYIRKCVFDKPIVIRQRNQSLDDLMTILMRLQKELNAIGHNFNQSVRQLNTFNHVAAVNAFLYGYEKDRMHLLDLVERIQERIHQIADIWLQ